MFLPRPGRLKRIGIQPCANDRVGRNVRASETMTANGRCRTIWGRDNKTFLHPLSTEGQGLAAYPGRKPYSLTQLCLPFGAGWKWTFSKRYDIIYELGYRLLFTDYLDDVSTTYVDPQLLLAARGPKAVEVAYRAQHSAGSYPYQEGPGDQRGNPNVKDWYFFSGLKLLIRLGKEL